MRFLVFLSTCIVITACSTPNKQHQENKLTTREELFTPPQSIQPLTPQKTPLPKSDSIKINKTHIIVEGIRPINSVEREIQQHLISVHYWYHREFNKQIQPDTIVVSFAVDALGVPSEPTLLYSTLFDSLFNNRVLTDITQWRFSRIHTEIDTTHVIYPIILEPAQQSGK